MVDINEIRSNFEKLGTKYKTAANVEIKKEIIDNIPCYWFYPSGPRSLDNVNLYLHGGCYAVGSINSHKALVSHLANETDETFLFIDYSLAPEHPFPKAKNEVLKVYDYLINEIRVKNISLVGDSAGGGLATAVVSTLNRGESISSLKQVIMISPWVDLRNNSESVEKNRNIDPVLTKESLDLFTSLYVGNENLSEVNPIENLFGTTFPPTLILVGSNEILLDDSVKIFSKIISGQPLSKLTIYPNQNHVWLMDNIHSEPSRKAINEIRNFMINNVA